MENQKWRRRAWVRKCDHSAAGKAWWPESNISNQPNEHSPVWPVRGWGISICTRSVTATKTEGNYIVSSSSNSNGSYIRQKFDQACNASTDGEYMGSKRRIKRLDWRDYTGWYRPLMRKRIIYHDIDRYACHRYENKSQSDTVSQSFELVFGQVYCSLTIAVAGSGKVQDWIATIQPITDGAHSSENTSLVIQRIDMNIQKRREQVE